MDNERHYGLGLESVLATSEIAEYVGVQAQAIYNLRTDGRAPSSIRVGREIRFCVSDVVGGWTGSTSQHQPLAVGRIVADFGPLGRIATRVSD